MPRSVGATMQKILGIFGNPVKHSLSPAMHNAAFKNLGLDYFYFPFHIEQTADLAVAVKALKILNFRGVNVTVPYKEAVIPFLDELTPEAQKIGAVNTIINEAGKLIGDNTDGRGFVRSLKENLQFEVKNKTVFIAGAGGAARAIAVSLVFAGAKQIFIADLAVQRAENIASLDKKIVAVSSFKDADLIINATPCGMENDATPFDLALLSPKNTVYDIVYNRETPLVKYCKIHNIAVMNGLMMLLYQGVLAFEAWTNRPAPVAVMKAALTK